MARAPTTLDSFNAIAEPKRRRVLDVLANHELSVNHLVLALGWPQPQVSKHLGVLRQVGLVDVRRQGRQQIYKLNASKLKPIHDWVKPFERFWSHHLDRIKAVAEAKARQLKSSEPKPSTHRRDSHE
jgi:DNA-binding transcriptional ArsR family regulator